LLIAQKGLKKLGLRLNEQKTRIVQSGPNVQFLGRKLPKPLQSINKNDSKRKGKP